MGAVYYVTNRAAHYVATSDGAINYAGSALRGAEALLAYTLQVLEQPEPRPYPLG